MVFSSKVVPQFMLRWLIIFNSNIDGVHEIIKTSNTVISLFQLYRNVAILSCSVAFQKNKIQN